MEWTTTSAPYSIGAEKDGRGDGVVDDQRHAVLVRDFGQAFDIGDVAGGIADAFAENGARIFVDQFFDVIGMIGGGEAAGDALLGQNVREQRVGGAVQLREGDDVVAHLRDIDERIVNRGHAGADAEGFDAAFEGGYAFFEDGVGGIADAGVDVALHVEIEEGGAVGGAIEFKRDGLVDGDRDGFGGGVAIVAGVDRKSFAFHCGIRAWCELWIGCEHISRRRWRHCESAPWPGCA